MKKIISQREKPILFSGLIWVVTYVLCLIALKNYSFNQTISIIIILFPILTFSFFVYTYIRVVSSMDEVEKRIQFEAVVIGFALGLIMLMGLELFELVINLNKNDWGYQQLIYFFTFFYFVGLAISKKKYS